MIYGFDDRDRRTFSTVFPINPLVHSESAAHVDANLFLLAAGAAVATYGTIALAGPFLRNYALAHPDHRSSHEVPTPQGGGIFVIATTVAAAALAAYLQSGFAGIPLSLAGILAATIALAIVGAVDDARVLQAAPRLILQTVVVVVVVAMLPAELHVITALPWWIERLGILLVLLWFVNLVNFMDGIDWMTVAESVPVTAALAAFGLMGALPREATAVAFALGGAMIGFAPFNRPVARLFLGDVGSLPIGLLLGWLLVLLADGGHLAAALLLPLYYLADATITLLRRIAKGEQIMQPHRSHFYQRATDGGFSVYGIVARVFLLNCILVALASACILTSFLLFQAAAVAAGCILVGLLLRQFARGKR
jgi:UDP-N-acetylmuramyl pentapeptide phosphotransferase/UDP-N-acetylglucosamine-1-phosphate transferase